MTGTVYTTNINLNNLIVSLCDGPIPCPEESYRVCACHCIERDKVQ